MNDEYDKERYDDKTPRGLFTLEESPDEPTMQDTKLANTSFHTCTSEKFIAASSDGMYIDIKAVEKPTSAV